MAYVLRKCGQEATQCGVAAPSALACLAEWAERIVVMQPHYASAVPAAAKGKIVIVDVGPDRWGNPLHPEIQEIMRIRAHEALKGD